MGFFKKQKTQNEEIDGVFDNAVEETKKLKVDPNQSNVFYEETAPLKESAPREIPKAELETIQQITDTLKGHDIQAKIVFARDLFNLILGEKKE